MAKLYQPCSNTITQIYAVVTFSVLLRTIKSLISTVFKHKGCQKYKIQRQFNYLFSSMSYGHTFGRYHVKMTFFYFFFSLLCTLFASTIDSLLLNCKCLFCQEYPSLLLAAKKNWLSQIYTSSDIPHICYVLLW